MGKQNLDDLLSELGLGGDTSRAKSRHSIDKAEDAFSPIPSMPANQGFDDEHVSDSVNHDPAIINKPNQTSSPIVGDAMSSIYAPQPIDALEKKDEMTLAQFLVESGAITARQLAQAEQVLKATPGRKLVDLLLEQGGEEAMIQPAIAQYHDMPFERIDHAKGVDGGFDGRMLQRLGIEFCKANVVLPLRSEGQRVVLGMTSPDNVFIVDDVRTRLGVRGVKTVLVLSSDVRRAIEQVSGANSSDTSTDDLAAILADVDEADVEVEQTRKDEDAVNLEEISGDENPVIRYVNHIIQTAVKEGASDIHIEPSEKKVGVRFRIDGRLFEMMNPPVSMAAAITSRIKIMGNMDISERRIPQDGRVKCTVAGRRLDLRVSTLPAGTMEKTVIRILDTKSIQVKLSDLGFSDQAYETWKNLIDQPHGIVLVTGPTGSGKTTTLYASLQELDRNSMNISTVEDPIEYNLDGITQTQMHEKIGMTFGRALKALLRQDPDVIMLGEIRDMETASTAIQASLTGHLVLSTLHTNDAPGSITRLVNIGVEPFLVAAAINGVLAQRLVRKLCPHCRAEEKPGEEMEAFLEMQGMPTDKMWNSKGCDRCRQTGYSGRMGIYELLSIDDHVRDYIARNPNVSEFRRFCIERGMVSLRQDGLQKVRNGITTVKEILRVTEATV